MTTQQFTEAERVTAVMHMGVDGPGSYSETYSGPVVIGHYGAHGDGEIWLEQEGHRIQIGPKHFAAVMRELKRANKIAAEAMEQQ